MLKKLDGQSKEIMQLHDKLSDRGLEGKTIT
jgi:hypothetical protein